MDATLEQKLVEYLNGVEKAVVELTPQAYELAKQAVRLDALMSLIGGVVWLITGLVFATLVSSMMMQAHKKIAASIRDDKIYWDDTPWYGFGLGTRIVGSLVAVGNMIGIAMDKHIWFGLISPELEMVRQLYLKLVGVEH